MKNYILLIIALTIANLSFGQSNFVWDIKDSVNKSKELVYTDTKLFIAQTWKSAQDVIQNDDKENGLILIKGNTKVSVTFQMNVHDYWYRYTIKFYQKENKFRIVLDDVHCESARCSVYDWPLVEPTEDCSVNVGGVPPKHLQTLMNQLKSNLQTIVDTYVSEIKKVSVVDDKW
jgi:hypothetical protein